MRGQGGGKLTWGELRSSVGPDKGGFMGWVWGTCWGEEGRNAGREALSSRAAHFRAEVGLPIPPPNPTLWSLWGICGFAPGTTAGSPGSRPSPPPVLSGSGGHYPRTPSLPSPAGCSLSWRPGHALPVASWALSATQVSECPAGCLGRGGTDLGGVTGLWGQWGPLSLQTEPVLG